MDRLKDINSTLVSQLNRLRNIQGTVQDTESLAEQARVRVEDTEDLISMASDMLEKAKMAADNVVSVLLRSHMAGEAEGLSFCASGVFLHLLSPSNSKFTSRSWEISEVRHCQSQIVS